MRDWHHGRGRRIRKKIASGSVWVLLLLLEFPGPARALSGSIPDDFCTGNPCLISSAMDVAPDTTLDFGTRDVTLDSKLTVLPNALGQRTITVRAGSLNIASNGKIFAFGPTSEPGGTITLVTVGDIAVNGQGSSGALSVRGNPAGLISLTSTSGAVTGTGRILLQASASGASGGDLQITASGNINLSGLIKGDAGNQGGGASLDLFSDGDIRLLGSVDISAGAGGGGFADFTAGGSVTLGTLKAKGGGENGDGGALSIVANGPVTFTGPVNLKGSGVSLYSCGDGGDLDVDTLGEIAIQADLNTNAPAGDCGGGFITMSGGSFRIDAQILSQGAGSEGFGGSVDLLAETLLAVNAAIKVDGGNGGGGDISLASTNDIVINDLVDAHARAQWGSGSAPIDIDAGRTLTINAEINGRGGSSSIGGDILLSGCFVLVEATANIHAEGDFAGIMIFASDSAVLRGQFNVGASAQFATIELFFGLRADPPDTASGSFIPSLDASMDIFLGSCQGCVLNSECPDNNPCTDDICDLALGCLNPPNDNNPCSDINACTLNDFCTNGVCIGGPPPNCDDGNPCTDDGCHFFLGCTHTANLGPCNDGDACSLVDTCTASGQCIGTNVTDCGDGNLCTDDICDGLGGCQNPPNTLPCEDGNLCTSGDTCSAGLCASGAPIDCSDGNICTDDLCDPAQGCLHSNNVDACDDQDFCSTNDRCSGGVCLAGPPLDCNDANLCTDDACNPATGCLHADNTNTCNDGDSCTPVDLCANGSCSGVGELDCDDGNVCTLDTCDTITGCGHELILDCTDLDGDLLVDRFDPCVTLEWSDPVSIPPDQNPGKFLLTLKKLDRVNGQDVQLKGFFRGPVSGPSFDPSVDGVHVRIADAGGELFNVSIPGGLRGTGPCGPKDGWKVGRSATSPNWRYSNQSGRLPPNCVPGSAQGISMVQIRDLRASGKAAAIQFKLKARDTSLSRLPALPIMRLQADLSLGMQSLGGEASQAARNGQCAEAVFQGNPVRSGSPKPFCKVKKKSGVVTNIICKGL